ATARVHLECDGRSLARILEKATGDAGLPEADGVERMSAPRPLEAKAERWEDLGQRFRRGNRKSLGAAAITASAGRRARPAEQRLADPAPAPTEAVSSPRPGLHLDNSVGGFTPEGDY